MANKRLAWVVLTIVAVMGVTTIASAQDGTLLVNITPPWAIAAQARWTVDTNTTQHVSGDIVSLPPGSHTVKFTKVGMKPANQPVTIVSSTQTVATGNYVMVDVWPSGVNPLTLEDVNGFCDSYQAILDNSLLSLLPPEYMALLSNLTPGEGDINGIGNWVNLNTPPEGPCDPPPVPPAVCPEVTFGLSGNGMLDCDIELKLVEEVLRDTAFSLNGLTHEAVYVAWWANDYRFNLDIGAYWTTLGSMANGLQQTLKGFIIVGDGGAVFSDPKPDSDPIEYRYVAVSGFAGFVQALMGMLGGLGITNPYIDLNDYVRMADYFAATGDADTDGASNICEFKFYDGLSNPALYLTNALSPTSPATTPTPTECEIALAEPIAIAGVTGGGTHQEHIEFSLEVTTSGGYGAITYQWSKGTSEISGATKAKYTFVDPVIADSGTYSCAIQDELPPKGSVNTGPIVVTVAKGLPVAGLIGLGVTLTALLGCGAFVVRRGRKS